MGLACWFVIWSLLFPLVAWGQSNDLEAVETRLAKVAGPVRPPAADTLVICAPGLRDALQPWIDYRAAQGRRIAVSTDVASAERIRETVARTAAEGALRHLLLVGDAPPAGVQPADASRPMLVPTNVVPARIIQRFGPETDIAGDMGYADVDQDGRPELAVGRLAVDSPQELQAVIRKGVDYERRSPTGPWRQRINLIAGVGGFGLLTDAVLETAVRSCLTRGIPAAYRTSMTYASWRSPYCPDPRSFRNVTLDRLNEGCFCWVYIGHGYPQGLDHVRVPTGVAPILNVNDVRHVDCSQGTPIAIFLSCYAGAFDGATDCLAERLVASERGPVAALAGSRMTMPYGMTVLSDSLMDQMFRQKSETLGELVLAAKQKVWDDAARGASDHPWMDAVAGALSPKPHDLAGERREHLWLFNLLGDPLLRIAHPEPLELAVPAAIEAGESLVIEGQGEVAGECIVELTCRRGRLKSPPVPRTKFDGSDEGMAALDEAYRLANEDCFAYVTFHKAESRFTVRLVVPEEAKGACTVRVFVRGQESFAMGAAELQVQTPPKPKPPM